MTKPFIEGLDEGTPEPEFNPFNEKPKIMIIGAPRSGKTFQLIDMGGIEEGNSKLVWNIDNKLMGIFNFAKKKFPKVKFIPIKSYDDFDFNNDRDIQVITIGLKQFEKLHSNLQKMLDNRTFPDAPTPGVVILDSLTLLADDVIKYALNLKGGPRKNTDVGVIDIASWPEYKAEALWLSSLFTDLKALNSIVVLTAHLSIIEKEVQGEKEQGAPKFAQGKEKKTERIVMTGGTKIGLKMPAYFHEIYLAKVEPAADYENELPKRLMLSRPTEDCQFAGSQFGVPASMDVTFRGREDDKSLWEHIKPYLNLENARKA